MSVTEAQRHSPFENLHMEDNGEDWPKLPVSVKVKVQTDVSEPLLVKGVINLPEANENGSGIINIYSKAQSNGYVLCIKILNYDNRHVEILMPGEEEVAIGDDMPLFVDILPILNGENTNILVPAIHGIEITFQKSSHGYVERNSDGDLPPNFRQMYPPNAEYPLLHATPISNAYQRNMHLMGHVVLDDLQPDSEGVYNGTIRNPFD